MHETWLAKFEFQMSILWRWTKEISSYIREEWMCPSRERSDSGGSRLRQEEDRYGVGGEHGRTAVNRQRSGCVWLKSQEGARISWQEGSRLPELRPAFFFFFLNLAISRCSGLQWQTKYFLCRNVWIFFYPVELQHWGQSVFTCLPMFFGWQVSDKFIKTEDLV